MSLASRARSVGRMAVSPQGTFMQTVAGGLSYYAHKLGSENVNFIRENFWAGPAVLAVLGHVIKQSDKLRGIGVASIGAAGYALAMGYALNDASKKQETKGLIEVGMYETGIPRSSLPGNMGTSDAPELSEFLPSGAEVDVSPSAYSIGR